MQSMEMVRRFWDFYRGQRNDIANFDTFYVRFFSPDFWRPNQERIELLLDKEFSEPILEAGCGSGWATFALHQKGFRPVSIDLLGRQLAQSSSFFKFFNLEGQWVQTNMISLPFPNEFFSSVIVFNVLDHVKNFNQALQELRRVLKPAGKMFVTLTNGWGSYALLENCLHKKINLPLKRFLKLILLGEKTPPRKFGIDQYQEHPHRKSWWLKQFQAGGFKVLRSINIDFISTALFPRIGYEKCQRWAQGDCRLAKKLPGWLASDWFFKLTKN